VVIAFLVAVCGGVGAVARFAIDGWVQSRWLGSFPLGTLVVNLSGSLLLGLLVGLRVSHDVTLVLGTALLGAYTTFSTWLLETHRAAQDGAAGVAWRSVLLALVLGVACAWLGRSLGRLL
jgi:CrcB protein